MKRGNIQLKDPTRFQGTYTIPREKVQKALDIALAKLERQIDEHGAAFADTIPTDYKYIWGENNNWVCGMQTACYFLAWQVTGNEKFLQAAKEQVKTYRYRFEHRIGLSDHDAGFAYSPSCVAAYKLLGDKEAYQTALDTAEYYYDFSYSEKGGFIIRYNSAKGPQDEGGCRTMMDTLMNIPFLFWAGQETGNQKYTDAALSQYHTTEKLLIRADGSSFHHYQFDPETHAPVRGLTWQGHSDDSTWSRGHSWAVYGLPVAYKYTGDEELLALHHDVTNFMLNALPRDGIFKWDLDFVDEEVARDCSAGLVAICGMHQACKYLPKDAPEQEIYRNAFAQILDATIDKCTGDIGKDYDGLVHHVTAALPQGLGIDECAIYGDLFYLEALVRYLTPDWEPYW